MMSCWAGFFPASGKCSRVPAIKLNKFKIFKLYIITPEPLQYFSISFPALPAEVLPCSRYVF